MTEKNVLVVTGANGFLGRSIVSLLQASGISVRATDLHAASGASDIVYRKADITRVEELKPVLENAATVIHVAGLAHVFSPDANSVKTFRQINEIGTANVASVAAVAGVGHLILISSVSVYCQYTQGVYDENHPCNPVGPYSLSKYNAELRAIEIARKSGMALTILRLATLYGEGDPGNVGRLMRMLDRGRFLWIGDGSNRKSLLYKGDAARACMAVAERPASGINIYNVSAPACIMLKIVDGIADALGKYPFPMRVPASLALLLSRHLSRIPNRRMAGLHQTVKQWLAEDVYDTRRFEEAYGFQTKTSLEDGLKQEVDWYRQSQQNGQVGRLNWFRMMFMKRIFDLLLSLCLVPVLLVPILVIAVLVRLTSRGPALYWSDRVGVGNKIFKMPKFRTMRIDTPAVATHLLEKPEIYLTSVGAFLRKYSLDEFPQLWNVIRGDMSFVGPRPALFNQDDLIELRTRKRVHELVPGITGWAQINGRDDIPIPLKVEYDEYYLKNKSFFFDLKIIFMTAIKVFKAEGVQH